MTSPDLPVTARVTHRFDASAERVYDAFLDPAKASRFLFATPSGENVRCDIDARVGGGFTITDRRHGEDIVHTGRYLELDRPRRIVFSLVVEKFAGEQSTVTLDIVAESNGCQVTLTHEMAADDAPYRQRTEQGWSSILDVAAAVVVDQPPTCGVGVAHHAAVPAAAAVMFEGLSETLSLHRRMLRGDDAATRREDEVYRDLAERWERITSQLREAAAVMAAQRDLPMAEHDESAWGDDHVRAFATFVRGQAHLLSLLRVTVPSDEQTLKSMQGPDPATDPSSSTHPT